MKQGYLMTLTLELVVTSLLFCNSESSNFIRLQGPFISNGTGRVEIFHQGKWGTVCDDSWDLNDAEVVCRQLGFAGAVQALQGGDGVPDGTGTIWLDEVACVGSEKYLANCGHPGWEKHDCSHGEDAGVRCAPKIRLQGPLISSGTGRVEISYQGKWGTVCDDDWDLNDAKVVCRQLGFAGAVQALQGSDGVPDGTGTIWLDEVACVGSEQYLGDCGHRGWEKHDCSHGEDAGVRCDVTVPAKGPTISTITSPSATELTVVWSKLSADDANGDITSYTACYQLTSSGSDVSCSISTSVGGADTTTVTLRGLNEATTYDVAVKATNRGGTGDLGTKKSEKTLEATPTKGPVLVSLSVESSTELNVAWLALSADDSNGIITQYQICYNSTDAGGDLCSQNIKSVIANTLTYTLTGLHEATTYEVGVRAKNSAGAGPLGNTLKRKTFEVEREKPTITKLLAYFSSIKILWEYPKVLDGRITRNEVCITRPRICKSVAGENRSVTLTHLIPGTKYNITVQGFTTAGAVQRVKVQARTQISQINKDLFTDSRSLGVDVHETQVSFKLPSLTATETNEIHFIQVIVKRLSAGEKFEALRHIPEENLTTYDAADGGFLPYITLRQNSYENEKLIVVGNGESSSNSLVQKNKLANVYINGPLKENTEYAILLRVYYGNGDAYSSSGILQVKTKDAKSSMSIVLIVVIVIVIFAAFLVVFGIVSCLRRRRNKRNNMNDKESPNINIGNPVYDDASPNNSNNCLASDLANVMLPENVYEAVADILPKRDPTTCGNYSRDVDGQTSTQENTYMELNIKKEKEENLYASLN